MRAAAAVRLGTPSIPWPLAIVAVWTVVGFVLRVAWLDSQPLWYDEQLQVDAATRESFWEMVLVVISHSAAAPLDYVGTRIFADAPRLWPALIGTLTIPLLYLAGRAWFTERVGVIAAVLLAVAPFHVYYSGEARYYAASAFVAVLAFWAFRRGGWWFGASVALCLWTYYFAVLVPLTLVAWYRRGLFPFLLGVVAFLPWVLLALPSQLAQSYPQAAGLSSVPTPTLLLQLLAPHFNMSGLPWAIVATLVIAAVALAAYGRAWLPLTIVVVGVVVTGLATFAAGYFWSPRQVLFVLPLFLLAIAAGMARFRWWGYVLVGWILVCVPFIDGVTGADAWQPRTSELTSP